MFEWDEQKRLINIGKHNLDFDDAYILFDGRPTISGVSNYPAEIRFITIGRIEQEFFTIVWTWRNDTRRIISYRRSHDVEKRKYCQIHS
jgi:uncharacterized protein